MKRLIALLICTVAILLPWRLRVFFANSLGWIAQGVYWLYFSLMRLIIKNLKKGENDR